MNIQQYVTNPQLITTLTNQQKLQLYTLTQQHIQQLQTKHTQLTSQLQLLQQEQLTQFTKLQHDTNLTSLQEIEDYVSQLQHQFTQQLQDILTQLNTPQSPPEGTDQSNEHQ